MKKLLFILLFLACIAQAKASELKYNTENLSVIIAGNNTEVFSRVTLLHNNATVRYSIKNLFDGNLKTAWATKYNENISGKAYEEGLFKIIFNKPIYIESISINNGYQKSEKIFKENQRIKLLSINKVITGEPSYPLESNVILKDIMGEQSISLRTGWTDSVNLFKIKELIFNVSEIYSGNKYNDLCISELKIKSSDKPSYKPSVTWPELKLLIDQNKTKTIGGWFWNGLNENNYKLFNDLLFHVLTNNKEAYQYFQNYKPLGVGSSEMMNFLYKDAVEQSLK